MTKKKIVDFDSASIDSLFYCVIDHHYFDPFDIIKNHAAGLNMLVMGNDCPEQVTLEYTLESIEWGKKEGIPIINIAGYPWIENPHWQKIYNDNTRICEGNALLFAINPPENNKIPKDLPAPSGILGNKLKKSDVEALSLLLDKNDIYVYDDFIYCLIVTKNENIYKDIISEVQKLINS